jgi:transcriptional regulator with XRE-family HTH domain
MTNADMSQDGLAREAGVSYHTVSAWVRGVSEPKGRQLVALSAALDREPAWFFSTPSEEAA